MKKPSLNTRIIINAIILLIILINALVLIVHYRQLRIQEQYLKEIIGTLNTPVEYTVEIYED